MIHLTFPDNSVRDFEPGVTGAAIAEGISKSLAKKAVAVTLDGELADLSLPIEADARIEIVTRDDPRAVELIRHDAAHVMAEAVQALWPGTQVTIGPVIENGFYYDFARETPFTPDEGSLSLKPQDQQALDGQLSSVATPTAKKMYEAMKALPPPVSDYVLSSSRSVGRHNPRLGGKEVFHEDTNLPKQTPCNTIGLPMNPLQADSYEREHSRDFLHDARKAEPQGSAFLDELFPPLATA